jgi:acyl carrier protein|tara:strand:- start:2524 stop:2742 length:219 start_codon:yes stop_codon:yes gene_type:complete
MNKIKLLQSFQKIFEKKKIKEKDNLEKIGLDSLKMLEIMAFNDEKFNKLKISPDNIRKCKTIKDLMKLYKLK